VSIAVAELIAGIVAGAPSLVIATGALIIDLQPPGAKDVVVRLFGTNDKLALNILIVVVALAIAAAVGIAAGREFGRAQWAFAAFGIVALVAALREPLIAPVLAVITTALAVGAGLVSLWALLALVAERRPVPGATGDVRRAKAILEDIVGEDVVGYRAPNFSIGRAQAWAYDILLEEGFRYDSSIYPIVHDSYGDRTAPRFPYDVHRDGRGSLVEVPIDSGVHAPAAAGALHDARAVN